MRTLTQVWVFFVSLTITLLIIGFQLKGRLGLFISFLFSLFLIYIILHRGVLLFKNQLIYKEQVGSDPTGFKKILHSLRGLYSEGQPMELHLFFAKDATPPLIWRDYPNNGHIVLHEQIFTHLSENEKVLLAHFLLSHLKTRPTFRPRLFSVFEMGFLHLQFLFAPLISAIATLFQSQKYFLQSDLLSLQNSHVTNFEFGYFLKKLHDFHFHRAHTLRGAEYFSALTAQRHNFYNNYGQPSLEKRYLNVMGFVP